MAEWLTRLRNSTHFYLVLTLLLVCAVLTLSSDRFLSLRNFLDLLTSYSFLAILAIGLMVVVVAGCIDISFTAIAAIAQYVMMSWLIEHGGNWLMAFGLAAGVGILLGALNAAAVHWLRIDAIIVSIATLNIYFGLLIFATNGDALFALPEWFTQGLTLAAFESGSGHVYSLSLPILALLAVIAVTWTMLNHSSLGRQLYAMGSNLEAAGRVGFNILWLRMFAFAYMGVLAGVASIVQAQLTQQVAPSGLTGRELEVFAAVALGGANLAGGTGSVGGTLLGIALLAITQNGLVLLGVSSYWSQMVVGALVVASVAGVAWTSRHSARRSFA